MQRGLLNSGQTCNATTRILVPRQRLEEAAREAGAVAPGMKARLGPLISERQFDRVQAASAQAVADGAELVEGGPGRLDGHDVGYFARPTVFISHDAGIALCQEEIFGPVLVLQPYDSLTELIELANATRYGLAAVVWGEDDDMLAQVVDGLEIGQIDLNAAAFNPAAPFGGRAASGQRASWAGTASASCNTRRDPAIGRLQPESSRGRCRIWMAQSARWCLPPLRSATPRWRRRPGGRRHATPPTRRARRPPRWAAAAPSSCRIAAR